MKNLQKLAVALLVGIMAIGFSAFKGIDKKATNLARYYNTSGIVGDTNPANFIYLDEDDDLCGGSPSTECSAQWITTNAPSLNQTPSDAGSPVRSTASGSSHPGAYNP